MKLLNIQDFDNQLLLETGQVLSKYTVQIYKDDIEKAYVSLGSGILFSFENNFFIITASHNFIHEGQFLGIKGYYIQAGVSLYSLQYEDIRGVPQIIYYSNKIDLAIVKLESQDLIAALIESKKFVTLEYIKFNPKQRVTFEKNSEPSDFYVLFGFPGTKTKRVIKPGTPIVIEKKFNVKAYCQLEYLRNKIPQELIDMGFTNHIFFSKIKKGSDLYSNKRLIKPVQNGMSGCGLWEIYADYVNGMPKLKLAGIFTEFQMGFGIAVQLKYAIAIIRQEFNLNRLPIFIK